MLAGSIGKSFVAAVVLNLAKEGTLGLDDKLETWLGDEDWYSRLPGGDQITLDMLLHHTSGIPPEIGTVDDIDRLVEVLHAPGFDPDTVSLPIFVEGALDRESVFAPGTDFFYTDTNYLLLGMVIEKATGSTYYQEVRDRILDPLNLTHTERSTNRVIAGLATGYTEAGNDLEIPERVVENGELVYNPGFEWTGGGLVSNVGDLVRWAKALFEEQVMTEPYVEELLRGVSAGGSEQYGLGVRIGKDELGTHYRHGGFMPGYRSHFVYYPEHQIAIAVQINRDFVLVRTTGITETKDICLGCAALDLARIVLDGLN